MEDFMLPCISKQLFGYDCLGCGMQRSLAFILRGEFFEALKMYPAIYTLIILACFIIFTSFKKITHQETIKKWLFIINIAIIVISYCVKLSISNLN